VPAQATAAALIIVGWLMISTLTEMEGEAEAGSGGIKLAGIDFHDLAIGLSAALAIMIMPFTYSITNGIGFGFITYTVICAARRAAQSPPAPKPPPIPPGTAKPLSVDRRAARSRTISLPSSARSS